MTQAVTTHAEPGTSAADGPALSGDIPAETAAVFREAFAPAADPAAAERFTRDLTHSHYENFSVVSFLLPKYLRQDFCNVYAFCRIGDDLADEIADREQALIALARFRESLHGCYVGRFDNALFTALGETIHRHSIPLKLFDDLLDAFEQDQRVNRYETFADLADYCRRSADPVGRLVLWMCGYRDAVRQTLSDKTCTALQLVNFWQDVRRDLVERNRIYLPADSMRTFGVDEAQLRQHIAAGTSDLQTRDLIRFECHRAMRLFDEGEALLPMLDRAVRGQISLFGAGGRAVLSAIRRQKYDTLSRRPSLSKWQKGRLVTTALMGRLMGVLGSGAFAPARASRARA